MKIGFTGTQEGMSYAQRVTFSDLYVQLLDLGNDNEFHDGDCIGADDQAFGIVTYFNTMNKRTTTVGHPPINSVKRAFNEHDIERKWKPYPDRNQDIVDETDVLIACPRGPEPLTSTGKPARGSGTWMTIRKARKGLQTLYIIWPNGTVDKENL